MLFHDFLAQFNSHSHCSRHSWLIVQKVTCKVQVFHPILIHKVLVQITIESLKQFGLALQITQRLYQTLRPIMNAKAFLRQSKLFLDFFWNQFPNFLCNLLLNLIMIDGNFFFVGRKLFGPFLCKLFIGLDHSNVAGIWGVLLLIETDEGKCMVFKENAVRRIGILHLALFQLKNDWNLFCVAYFREFRK